MEKVTLPVASLLLYTENPRHDAVGSQIEAIEAIITDQGSKLVELAKDIALHGMSPIDRLLVVKQPRGKYMAAEGNRRLAALKLLENPEIAKNTAIHRAMKDAATDADVPREVDCAVAASLDEARHWMRLRHAGEAHGRGVVRWNAMATSRFDRRPGTQAAAATSFIDALAAAYPGNTRIQDALAVIGAGRLTTLGRLVKDPDFRQLLGVVEQPDGTMLFHYDAQALESVIERVLADVAGDYSVSKLKGKEQRTAYLAKLPPPPAKSYQQVAVPLDPAVPIPPPPATPPRRPTPPKPGAVFKNLVLHEADHRTAAILKEIKRLDPGKFPNAVAIMIRALVELIVAEFYEVRGWTGDDLRKRVQKCLRAVDPSEKDPRYQAVRTGLQDSSSLHAMKTLHQYVHNPKYHPTEGDVRAIAANFEGFLQALDDLLV